MSDEKLRYDRQIRLWGSATQKQLHDTAIVSVGIDGVVSETLKNLVLAGVGSVSLWAPTPCSVSMSRATHLITHQDVIEALPLHDAISGSLKELNPHVVVSTRCERDYRSLPAYDKRCVVLISSDGVFNLDMQAFSSEALMVIVFALGPITLCQCLGGSDLQEGATLLDILRGVFTRNIALKPRWYVLAALTILTRAAMVDETVGASVVERLPAALHHCLLAAERLGLKLADDDVQSILDLTLSPSVGRAVEASIGGGHIAQQLISRIAGGGESGSCPPTFEWVVVSTIAGPECLVGS